MKTIFEILAFVSILAIAGMHAWFLWRFLRNERRMQEAEEEFVARLQHDQERLNAFVTDMRKRRKEAEMKA